MDLFLNKRGQNRNSNRGCSSRQLGTVKRPTARVRRKHKVAEPLVNQSRVGQDNMDAGVYIGHRLMANVGKIEQRQASMCQFAPVHRRQWLPRRVHHWILKFVGGASAVVGGGGVE